MKTRAQRVAERRKRQRARHRARERRFSHPLADRPRWWLEGLEETPTDEIVATLAQLGIQVDDARFREQAILHKTVDALAEVWGAQGTAIDHRVDYYWLAARALWARWVPDLFSISVFIEQHLPDDAFGESAEPETAEEAERHWRMALVVMDLVAPADAPSRPDLLDELSDHAGMDIGWWLSGLPFTLAYYGMVDEAVRLCARLAPIHETENLLGDRAVILAEAGRHDDALRQVEANLARFPKDVWIRIKAGDVYRHLGDREQVESTFRTALELAEAGNLYPDNLEARERLVQFLAEIGRKSEADALLREPRALSAMTEGPFVDEDEEDADDFEPVDATPFGKGLDSPLPGPTVVPRNNPKPGRNNPCSCGSGKKFKRCCGR